LNSKLIKVAESKPPASARIRQTTWSFGASFLKGLDLRALISLTQYSGKPSRAEGTRLEQQILKNRPFHPVNEFWKGVRRTMPGTLLFRPVDRDVFVHDLNRQLGTPSRWLPVDSCKKEDKEAP